MTIRAKVRTISATPASLCLCLVGVALLVAGCSGTTRATYDAMEARHATIAGFRDVRMYLDERQSDDRAIQKDWAPARATGATNYLFISGGGAGGAFAVGVLSAWTKLGSRPDFDMVTGVSTGALIAPYAFLGQQYDARLIDLYTSGKARELIETRWMGSGLLGTSLLRPDRLRKMVERSVTTDLLVRIAAEQRRGRRLFVLTTNLDSQRAVIWNMGAIAASGQPGALVLFRDILMASASVPGAFPAVMIKAQVNGKTIEEMHSDGGSASQVLTLPEQVLAQPSVPRRGTRKLNFYVIINNALIPEFENMPNKTIPVAARAYAILIKSQTRDALLALYGYARRTGANFHVATIDKQIPYSMSDPFETQYMREVFVLGYSRMVSGSLWRDKPLF